MKRYLQTFPAVLVTGSRQVGKTTLVKNLLADKYRYVLLEDPDQRTLATTDPKRFLEKYAPPVIFDEFHLVPELPSYLQGMIDQNRKTKGQFVLTGSQNFVIMEQVNQSLAGRIGVLTMYGLNSEELPQEALKLNDQSLGSLLLRGSYPELWDDISILSRDWYASYVQTYLERDVRNLANVGDLISFERFIKVCAARTAQTVNYADMAADAGVSPSTAERWLSILESTFLVRLLQPYHVNLTSRVKKTPKMYFMDTGLACYLMGFRDPATVMDSPQYGALFETLVYSDFIKRTSSTGDVPDHFFLQTKSKVGVDLIIQRENKIELIEIKGARTLAPSMAEQLQLTHQALKPKVAKCSLVGPFAESQFKIKETLVHARPWYLL